MAMLTSTVGRHRRLASGWRQTCLVLLLAAAASLLAAGAALAQGGQKPRTGPAPGDRQIPADDPTATGLPHHAILHMRSRVYPTFMMFLDPDPYVVCKEFAFFYNTVPAPARGQNMIRGLFHLVYQRSAASQANETTFGHAWSMDLFNWSVDTVAFTVDETPWNKAHVWSPSIVHHGTKDYLFYTGVDSLGDQRIGYASTDLLDTTNTVWDANRVMVWEAADTKWAVPQPWTYAYYTQFRDPFVMDDPEHPGQLLLYFNAHDSTDFALGKGGLVVGVARSEPGDVNTWQDLGYLPSTAVSITHVGQLEGPHLIRLPGENAGWRLMFSNAGTPPGESGQSTIRFETLVPGASVADTSSGNWSVPSVLSQYLNGVQTVFGWSGSEYLRVGNTHYLAGFTAWGPLFQGIAMARMNWTGNDFTLGGSLFTGVDPGVEPGPPGVSDVRLRLFGGGPPTRQVTFAIESPRDLDARLEVFDTMGRRLRTLLAGRLPRGGSSRSWDLTAADGAAVPNGVYFARLSFAGGVRAARVAVVR